ncbi:hypothetical protein [Chitinilyticum piscinae]|uniref:Uncharacterized protein n=1 Tax=Chitinilyticum piscinae TaxID=2866724 RepID=A0A8J7FKZ6_9NEIS|nr:hypothetical protein [Chitinilyticum piscinae]MBE9609977.1 hypothetical protein [Chitinilyticum piscinae]
MSSAELIRQKLQAARMRRLGRVNDLAGLQQRLDYLFEGKTPGANACGQHQLVFFLPTPLDELVQTLQRKTGAQGWRDVDDFIWAFEDESGNYTLTLQSARSQCLVVASVISLAQDLPPAGNAAPDELELEVDG